MIFELLPFVSDFCLLVACVFRFNLFVEDICGNDCLTLNLAFLKWLIGVLLVLNRTTNSATMNFKLIMNMIILFYLKMKKN